MQRPTYHIAYILIFMSMMVTAGEGEGLDDFVAIDKLPVLHQEVQTRQFCTYDRAGDNYDHEYFEIYTDNKGECVIFDAYGPGCLWRHHMNIWKPWQQEKNRWEGIRIRYYLDGEEKPFIDMDISKFFSKENELGVFTEPFGYDGGDNFRLLYLPVYFQKRLKVTLNREPGGAGSEPKPWMGPYNKIPKRRSHWYQYTYHLYTKDLGPKSGIYPEVLKKHLSEWEKVGKDPKGWEAGEKIAGKLILNGGEVKTLAVLHKPGVIGSIKVALEPFKEETLYNCLLRIYFDDEAKAKVEVPAGLFFGVYRTGLKSIKTLLFGVQDEGTMYCYLPMPYWKCAKVEVYNKGSETIKTLKFEIGNYADKLGQYPKDRCGYFQAVYHKEFPRTEGVDYTCLEKTGCGQVVGHTIARWDTCMEEDERTYLDGSGTPAIYGDGFEDDHNMGWGLKNISHPVFGAASAQGGAGLIYRLYIPDWYVFHNHIKHGHQCYGPNSPVGHEGMYTVGREESVTYFYGKDKASLKLTDELDVGDKKSKEAHQYRAEGEVKNKIGAFWYDGEKNNVLLKTAAITDEGAGYNKFSQFTVKIDPGNQGVKIRRRTDKENNRQTARVYVEGEEVKERPWYMVDYDKTFKMIRWRESDFEIPADYTKGKGQIQIRVEYEDSENGVLDDYYYWIYSYVWK